jgi:hypothetical protein
LHIVIGSESESLSGSESVFGRIEFRLRSRFRFQMKVVVGLFWEQRGVGATCPLELLWSIDSQPALLRGCVFQAPASGRQ